MSLPSSANYPGSVATVPVEKQRTNIYTVMLMLSFAALMTGCILLALEWQRFEGNPPWDTRAAQPSAAPAAPMTAPGVPAAPVAPAPVAPVGT
jgi:hypothetical protein